MPRLLHTLHLRVTRECMGVFDLLLAEGIPADVEVGRSVEDILCRQMGLDPAYLRDRVQTVFLNGRAVDDVEREPVADGGVIALSAAMPGLAGAVFRKKGTLASLRSLPAATALIPDRSRPGRVTIKLFNLIARDLGPKFLEKGIRLDWNHLLEFFQQKSEWMRPACRELIMDDQALGLDEFLALPDETGEVLFSVREG